MNIKIACYGYKNLNIDEVIEPYFPLNHELLKSYDWFRGDYLSDQNGARYMLEENCDIKGNIQYRKYFYDNKLDGVKITYLQKDTIEKIFANSNIQVVLPYPEHLKDSIELQYLSIHIREDWEIFKDVIFEIEPELAKNWQRIMNSPINFYHSNLIIARTDFYDDLYKRAFNVIFEVEKRIDLNKLASGIERTDYEKRVLGYLLERFLNLYLHSICKSNQIYNAESNVDIVKSFSSNLSSDKPFAWFPPIVNKQAKYNFVIVAMMKNEAPYIKEWINHHLNMGFEHIYLIDDGSTDNTVEIAKETDVEKVTIFNSRKKYVQTWVYKSMCEFLEYRANWALFIDIDEFLILDKNVALSDYLNEKCFVITFNWMVMSFLNPDGTPASSDVSKPVMERFRVKTKENFFDNRHIKSMVRPTSFYFFMNPHIPTIDAALMNFFKEWNFVERSNKKSIFNYTSLNRQGSSRLYFDFLKEQPDYNGRGGGILLHFMTKSKEEYTQRKKPGTKPRADSDRIFTQNDFDNMLKVVEENSVLTM